MICLQPNSSSSSSDVTTTSSVTSSSHSNTTTANNDSLTTPIMSLTTPSLFSSLPPSLSSLPTEFPLGSAVAEGGSVGGSTSALVAFPISIQPGAGNTPGNNVIIQAQNMGQPFLLTPTPYDKQTTNTTTSHVSTPPTSIGSGYSSLRDLEQLKLQYDRIYQQISETLQLHEQNKQNHDEQVIEKKEDTKLKDEVTQETVAGQKRELDQETNSTTSDSSSGEPPTKVPHLN